ncbi:ankyrin repeat-containing domain protein [Pyronema omphalodes]|nr:ankyrin repeat-containing domain protein [Pyronema omphalodes]
MYYSDSLYFNPFTLQDFRGKSELEAVHTLLLAPDAMIMIMYCVYNQKYFSGPVSDAWISCRRNLPPEILRYLYTDVAPQLATFGINLPGMANCSFTESDYSNGCKTEKLRCSCCSYQRYDIQDCKSGWVCEELQNVYYAETREKNVKEMITPKGDAHSSKTPQEPIEFTPGTITFRQLSTPESAAKTNATSPWQDKSFSSFQIKLTNGGFDEFPTLSLMKLLGIRLVCEEWDKIIQAYSLRLNDVRKEVIIRDKPDPRSVLLTLDKAAEAASELENMHNLQFQLLESLNDTKKRMENFGNTIQESISKKVDSLFQRASNIVSIEEAYKSREQGASMKRLSWITFIFLPLLFVASLYGMNIDLLANNPSWTTCFYIGAPVFLAVMAAVSILKYRKIFRNKPKIRDEENPTTATPSTLPENWLLFDAAEQRNAGLMQAMIERMSQLDVRNEENWNPLQLAARNGHDEVVDLMLRNDTLKSNPGIVNAPPADLNGRTALQAAAENGHGDIVNRLLDAGADVNAEPSDWEGRTALQAAAGSGHGDIVNHLLDVGADVNAAPCLSNGGTALQAAAENGHGDIVNRLLVAGAVVNAEPAAAGSGHGDIVNRLLDAGANVNAKPGFDDGRTALQAAAENGHEDIVNRLLDAGADVNADPCWGKGRTALQAAAGNGHGDIVNRLLDAGADLNGKSGHVNGTTALQAAAGSGHGDIVNRLLDAGANANADPCWENGRTALVQAAAGNGHEDIVNRLLDAGAAVNSKPGIRWGMSALQAAAKGGHLDVVERLLRAGASLNSMSEKVKTNLGTALDVAKRRGHTKVVNVLRQAGAKPNNAYFWRVAQSLYSVYDRQAFRIKYRYWAPLKRRMADILTWTYEGKEEESVKGTDGKMFCLVSIACRLSASIVRFSCMGLEGSAAAVDISGIREEVRAHYDLGQWTEGQATNETGDN